MNKLQELQAKLTHAALSAKEIISRADGEGRPTTPDEQATFDRLIQTVAECKAQIKQIQDHQARADELARTLESMEAPQGRRTPPDQPSPAVPPPAPSRSSGIPANVVRTRPLKAFQNTREGHEDAYRGGMWCRAAIFADQRALSWCLSHGVGTDIRAALGTTPNSSGGFLVPVELSQRIIDLREAYGKFRQNVFVQPMGRDSMNTPRRLTGITVGPLGENPSSAASESNPTWNNVQLNAKKCGALAKLSSEISEDAVIDLADWIASEFAYGFGYFEDQCGFIGDGTSTYLGIAGLTNLMTVALGLAGAVACATATHDTFAEIDATDLAGAMGVLPEYARANAKWYCSAYAREMVFGRLKAAAGGNNPQTLSGDFMDSYAGYPIVTSQVLPAGPSTDYSGLPMLFFGDLSKSSTLGDRREIRIFPSDHRYMDTDQIGILGTSRFDIVNHDLGTTSAAGPIVALCGGAS